MKYDFFDAAFDDLLKLEGEYVNDPDDKGGETKFGISKKSYPNLDIKNLTANDAKSLYYKDFWTKNKCYIITHYGLAEKIFNLSVNLGCNTAIKLLQRSLRTIGNELTEDGVIGPKTISALLKANHATLLASLKSEAASYYRVIVIQDPSQNKFLAGWLNRAYA